MDSESDSVDMYLNPYFAQQMSAARTREAVEAGDQARLAAQTHPARRHRAAGRWAARHSRTRPATVAAPRQPHPQS